MEEAQRLAYEQESEAAFQAWVIEAAERFGWLAYHTHDSRRSEPGFPDLVLVRPHALSGRVMGPQILYAELKRQKGKTTPAQDEWIARLRLAGQVCYVWRPADRDDVIAVLQ